MSRRAAFGPWRWVAPSSAAVLLGALLAAGAIAQPAAPIVVRVDASAARRAISPLVYGVAHATPAELAELNVPLHRLGGNHASRYNWEVNAYNRALDWFFESVAEPGDAPGAAADAFVERSRAAGALPMITVPAIGWVARLGPARGRLASFSIAKYGPQAASDTRWFPDAGNGVRPSREFVTGNDPRDANVAVDAAFQQRWVRHLVSRWGAAAAGGVRYYVLDNEPSLWHVTHRDVRPTGATMEEVLASVIEYSTAVKGVDPGARVVGPEEWGWPGYLYSGFDQHWAARHGWSGPLPDRTRHGGADYLPWLLEQLARREVGSDRRYLDVVSVHYYPQGGEYGEDVSASAQRRRNRSTRSLWDPSYVDESWIAAPVQLIPRLRRWVDTHYRPGVPIGITEYNWGAERHVSGALAQADVLGIFGREGLDLAARWATPDASTPAFKAIKMYRNYDGAGSTFGEVSVSATGPDPDDVAVFAAERERDGAITVMVVNKRFEGTTPMTLRIDNVTPRAPAERWQLDAGNTIARLDDVAVEGGVVRAVLPRQSITLLVIARTP